MKTAFLQVHPKGELTPIIMRPLVSTQKPDIVLVFLAANEGATMTQLRNPVLRTSPRLANLNMNGNIFGGWVLSQMDIAGGITAARRAKGTVATIAIEAMKFLRPIKAGDIISVYAEVLRVGTTSLSIHVEVEAERMSGENIKVTEGEFIFVALDGSGQPRPVDPPDSPAVE